MKRPRPGEKVGMTLVLCPKNNMRPTWANNPGSGGKGKEGDPRCTKCGELNHSKASKC